MLGAVLKVRMQQRALYDVDQPNSVVFFFFNAVDPRRIRIYIPDIPDIPETPGNPRIAAYIVIDPRFFPRYL